MNLPDLTSFDALNASFLTSFGKNSRKKILTGNVKAITLNTIESRPKGSIAPAKSSFLRRHRQKLVPLIFWLLLIGAYFWYATAYDLTPLSTVQLLITFLRTSWWGPLIYILLYALRPLIFFPATLLSIAAGTVFGPILGFGLVLIAGNISASVAWFVGRLFGEGILSNPQASGVLQKYANRMRSHSFETVMIMRFIFLPYDLVNYLAGFLRISWRPFILATLLGSIPGSIAFVGFGASIQNIDGVPQLNPWVLVGSGVIFAISIMLSRLLRRREGAHN